MEEATTQEIYWTLYGFDVTRIRARWLTRHQLIGLFQSMRRPRDVLLYGLMAETGAKLGEALSLTSEDFAIPGHIQLPRRMVPVPPDLEYMAQAIGSGDLFSITSRQAQRRLRDLGDRIGIPKMKSHLFRTSFAVHWMATAQDVSKLAEVLGYRDPSGVHTLLQLTPAVAAGRNDFPFIQVVNPHVSD